MIVVLQSSL